MASIILRKGKNAAPIRGRLVFKKIRYSIFLSISQKDGARVLAS